MKQQELISVIIPVYNVQRYLPRCIESIIKQTYQNIEIILVDDGSTDKSGKICDKYAKKDRRFVVIHKCNEGVSVARNAGIDVANGEYITFIDSDDWVRKDYVEVLYKAIDGNDLVVSALKRIYFQSPKYKDNDIEIAYDFSQINNIEDYFFNDNIHWRGPCCKLYKSKTIKSHSIYFPEEIKAGEDSIFVLDYIYHCNSIIFIDKYLYFYNRYNDNSALSKFYTDYIDTVKIVLYKKQLLVAKLNNYIDSRWDLVILQDVYLMINYYSRKLTNADDFTKYVQEMIHELERYNIDLVSKKYIVPNYVEYDYSSFLINNDFEGLFNYLREKQFCNYRPNKIKQGISKIIIWIQKFLIFDLKVGYWK